MTDPSLRLRDKLFYVWFYPMFLAALIGSAYITKLLLWCFWKLFQLLLSWLVNR